MKLDVTKISREERKQLLRDWMTSQIQLQKVKYQETSEQIAEVWRSKGFNMNVKWVNKALYGHVSKTPKGGN